MILLIDNYDSFSYNLYQLVGSINPDIKVIRNDELTVSEIAALHPERIILSPGPGRPEDAGVIMEVAKKLSPSIPILGVCLGHQAICAAFGATVTYAQKLMHGKQSTIEVDTSCPLFAGLPEKVEVARYHSLAVDEKTLPSCLKVTAATCAAVGAGADGGAGNDGASVREVMAVAHRDYTLYGVQFHPESVMTPQGMTMLRNFLSLKPQ